MGTRSCELGIPWSNLVKELRNNKYMGGTGGYVD